MVYMIAYGNKYIVNVEESNTIPEKKDYGTIILNFLDSVPDIYIENILQDDGSRPEDWFDRMFFEYIPMENMPNHFLGIVSYEYYISEIKGEDLCSIY